MITAETVNGIVRFQANGLPVMSLYCRVDRGASQREVQIRVDSLLDQIRPLAKDRALDHRYRLSVRGDIERIKDALGSERWPPGTIAIFSCSGRDLYEEIPLPRRVREQVMVDATPLARPMLAVLGEYSRACVLVVNREVAPVWEMYQDAIREVETVREPLRKGGNTGSRTEDRIQNRVDEQTKRHFRRVACMIDQLQRGRDTPQRRKHSSALPARAGPAAGGPRPGAGRGRRAGRARPAGLPVGRQHVRDRHAAGARRHDPARGGL
jgi:peptide chain release factor subunit 1